MHWHLTLKLRSRVPRSLRIEPATSWSE